MSRARIIKPGFFKNEELSELPPLARLLWAGIWTIADRDGRLEDRPRKIKAELLPYDECDGEELIAALAGAGFLLRYEASGKRYLQVVNWKNHQQPHVKEQASAIPAPDMHGASTVQAPDMHESSTEDAHLDTRYQILDTRYQKKEKGTRERAAATPPTPEPSVQIVASLSEITDDTPYLMVAMLCGENGKAVDAMPADWRGMQLGIAKRLLLNHSIEQVRAYVRYRKTAWNGNEPFDLRRVEKDIGAWELAGSPATEPVRAPPKGGGVGQAMERAADIWEKHEQYKNGASSGTGDMAGVHGADQGGVSPIKARVR